MHVHVTFRTLLFAGTYLLVQALLMGQSTNAQFIRAPLAFELNQGQMSADVRFLSRLGSYSVFLTADGAKLLPNTPATTRSDGIITMNLRGANAGAEITGLEPLEARTSYFLGTDPQMWRAGVPNFARVAYRSIYPGIDMAYHGNEGSLQYDFIVAGGANPDVICLEFDVAGRTFIDASGDLIVETAGTTASFQRPVSYQDIDGKRRNVSSSFVNKGRNRIGFKIGKYDRTKPLVIDPTLIYSSYLGGSLIQFGQGVAVDALGNVYVAGSSTSANFPTTGGAFGQPLADKYQVAFVAKFNASGSALLYSAFIGGVAPASVNLGAPGSKANAIAIDRNGNAYITGRTDVADFPTTAGAFQRSTPSARLPNAFVSKLSANGSTLLYSSLLGGNRDDEGFGIAVDDSGNAYVTGSTFSDDFPTTSSAFQRSLATRPPASLFLDAFITKVNPSGSALVYSTYLGGFLDEKGTGIALDASGDAYVIGTTQSPDFPFTPDAYQIVLGGDAVGAGNKNAFVTKLSPDGSSLVYSTYLGNSNETGNAITVDANGNAYAVGFTGDSHFPTTPNAYKRVYGPNGDGFLTKFSVNGKEVVYSTFLGIGGASSVALDPLGNSYVVGSNGSIMSLDNTGSTRRYLTALPANTTSVAVDNLGYAYVTGSTSSATFPVTSGAFQTATAVRAGGLTPFDVFVTKISPDVSTPEITSPTPTSILATESAITLIVRGRNFESNSIVQWNDQDRETKFLDISSLSITLSSGDLITPGTVQIRVSTPNAGTSAPFAITVAASVPVINTLTPTSASVGTTDLRLTIFGRNFTPKSVVRWNGQDRPTQALNSSILQATISGSDLGQTGLVTVTVFNPPPGGGLSNSASFTVFQPAPPATISAPLLTSLNPTSTTAGVSTFLTITGQNFVSGRSFIQWNGETRATSFVGPTQLRTFLDSTEIPNEGTVQISVVNTSPGGGVSVSLPFTITAAPPAPPNPQPTLVSPLYPYKSQQAGSPGFTLNVSGRDFVSGSVVRWNGQNRPTTASQNSTGGGLDASISADDLRSPTVARVSVSNPAPGGGSSFSLPFAVYSNSVLPIENADLIYDPLRRKIYVSRPGISRTNRNSISIVDPERGVIESSIALSAEPGKLAISDDSSFLYIVVNGGLSIHRLNLATQQVDLQFGIGSQAAPSRVVQDMEVMPGNPHALAVATRIPSISSPGGVAIFDDGVKRPKEVADVNVIEFGSSSILYGCYLGISSSPFSTMAVDASGLSVVNTTSGFCGSDFKLDGGLAYTLNGTVFQPQTRQPVTSYVIDFGKSGSPVAFKPDSLLGRTFFLTSGSAGYKELLIFDQNAFGLVGSVQLTNAFSGVGTVIRWGDDGLAYRTGLYEIDLLHIPREWLSPVQSTQFAHIGNGTGLSTSVLVTNPSASTVATGSINFFSDSGSNFSLFSQFAQLSTVPFAVPPLGLFRYSTNGHDNLLTGSAKVVTNAAASGVVKFGAPGLGIAGVGASVPARAIILPVVRDAKSKLNTGVAIANPGKDPTGVQISLRTLSGQNVPGALTLITLAANAHTARFIDELFPAIDTANFQGTLVASALSVNANIAATAIQIGAAPGEFTTLPVASLAPPTTARELSFPQFANGSGFTSSFFLTNPSPNTISGVIRFYDDNGSPISVPMEGASRAVEIPLSIPSLGAVILTTAGGETLQSGSARVTADGPIGGVLRYNFPGLGLAGVGASDPAAGFLLPVTRNADAGRSTGIGIAAGSSAVNLVFTLRTSAGEPVPGGETRLNLPANGHTARFIHELFPQADTRAFEGTLTVTAEGGLITATGIEIGSTAGEFTTLPASVLQ